MINTIRNKAASLNKGDQYDQEQEQEHNAKRYVYPHIIIMNGFVGRRSIPAPPAPYN